MTVISCYLNYIGRVNRSLLLLWIYLIVASVLYLGVDQGRDLMRGYDDTTSKECSFYAVLCAWSLYIWLGARIVLYVRTFGFHPKDPTVNEDKTQSEILNNVLRNVPKVMSMIPFLIAILAGYLSDNSTLDLAQIFLVGMLFILSIIFRRYVFFWKSNEFFDNPTNTKKDLNKLGFTVLSSLSVGFILFVLLFLFGHYPAVPIYIGALNIGIIILMGWAIVTTLMTYIAASTSFPVSFILFALMIFSGFFNSSNNNVLDPGKFSQGAQQIPLDSAITHYLNNRAASSIDNNETIYLFSFEGGGYRSGIWSTILLHKINTEYHLYDNNRVFSISSVSGGSFGSALYDLIYVDNRRNKKYALNPTIIENGIKNYYEKDALAGLLATLGTWEVLQLFCPFNLGEWTDRSKSLEETWNIHLNRSDSLVGDENLFRKTPGQLRKEVPFLPYHFYNSTNMETGGRAINAEVVIDDKDFNRADDIRKACNGADLPVNLAVGLSSRFPLFTPVTYIKKKNNDYLKIADGGYFDNYGIQTSIDIYDAFQRTLDSNSCYNGVKFNFKLVLFTVDDVKDGRQGNQENNNKPSIYLPEFQDVPATISKTLFGHSEQMLAAFEKRIRNKRSVHSNVSVHTLSLPISVKKLPTGWYLSDEAVEAAINTINTRWNHNKLKDVFH